MDQSIRKRTPQDPPPHIDPLPSAPKAGDPAEVFAAFIGRVPEMVVQLNKAWDGVKAEAAQDKEGDQ